MIKILNIYSIGFWKLIQKLFKSKGEGYLLITKILAIVVFISTSGISHAQTKGNGGGVYGHRIVPYSDPINMTRIKSNPKNDVRLFPLYKYVVDTSFVNPLRIGDTLTDDILDLSLQVIDSLGKKQIISLRDFSSQKLLVLDFWTTWCSPCIKSMIKWESLQSKLPNKIILIGVHLDFDYKVKPFLFERGWKSPTVIGLNGYVLNRYFFDRDVISRTVWIKDRKVVNISDAKDFGEELIERYLEGEDVKLPRNLDWTYREKGVKG